MTSFGIVKPSYNLHMAIPSVATAMSVEAYLASALRPDCDYVEGRLEERNLGEYDHGRLQGLLFAWFLAHEREWNVRVSVEQRMQVSPNRFRVPDICVCRSDGPIEQVVRQAPLICIEVLSREDTLSRLGIRVDEYLRLGVEHVWVLDPDSRTGWVCTLGGWNHPANRRFTIPGTDIHVPLDEIFGGLGPQRPVE